PWDRRCVAVERSIVMIRQRPQGAARVIQARADALPLATHSFDAALAVVTVHHWGDWQSGLREMRRVAERVVMLTFDLSCFQDFWLVRDYIPAATAFDRQRAPSVEAIAAALGATRIETVMVPRDCVDGFC